MTKNPKQTSSGDWTIKDFYDLIMFDIEPELTTYMIPDLEVIYKDETKEERKMRAERYAEAFAEFEHRFKLLMSLWKGEINYFKDDVLSKLKSSAKKEDLSKLKDIEKIISDPKNAV